MPTFEVQIDDPGIVRGRRLRVPAPDAVRARRRAARRALALEHPGLGETLRGEDFRDLAKLVERKTKAIEVGR